MKALSIAPAHVVLLATLQQTPSCPRFVVIGAAALSYHVALARTTADVDLAIVAEPEQLLTLLGPLG